MIVNCTKKVTREQMYPKSVTFHDRVQDVLISQMNNPLADPAEWVEATTIKLLELFADERRFGR